MKIAILLGSWSVGQRPLDFWLNNIFSSQRGLTGTEITLAVISKELKNLGNNISMFTVHAQPEHKPEAWEGVRLYNFDERFAIIDDSFDAVISINEPDAMAGLTKKPLKICWQFLNDFTYCSPGFDDHVDLWFGVCDMHTEHLKKLAPKPEKWGTLPLGVYEDWYEIDKKVPGRMIFCSSADRGLHWALDCYPDIKKAVPEAHLKIFYHFEYGTILNIEPNDTANHPHVIEMAQRLRYCKSSIEKLKPLGVEHVGSVSADNMRKEMSEASILLYPVDPVAFSEGFSLSIMQSCMAGAIPVISSADCIGSIYKDSGALMIGTPVRDNLEQYKELVIKALKDSIFAGEVREKTKTFAKKFLWGDIAKKMEQIIKSSIGATYQPPSP